MAIGYQIAIILGIIGSAQLDTHTVSYIDEGKSAPALEFLSAIKGPSLPPLCVEVGLGMKTAEQAAAIYDKDVEKQAQQLGIEGW